MGLLAWYSWEVRSKDQVRALLLAVFALQVSVFEELVDC